MAVNKVIYAGNTLIDLTGDTVTKDKVLSGYTFHGKDGVKDTGTCTYDSDTSDATLEVAEALTGQVFYANGSKKTGTMPNNGAISKTISNKNDSITIPQGYHDGSGTVAITTTEKNKLVATNIKHGVTLLGVTGTYDGDSTEVPQPNKNVTPSTSQQVITPDAGYTCLSQVTVAAIPYVESPNSYGTTVTIG